MLLPNSGTGSRQESACACVFFLIHAGVSLRRRLEH